MWNQTHALRFGPSHCNIGASVSESPSSASSGLYGSNAHTAVPGGKLLNSALPFLLLSVCPAGHPLIQLSHLIYMRDGCIWILQTYFVSLAGEMGIFVHTSIMNQG